MLERIADNLWSAESILRMPGGARLPIRMSVIRLEDGSLVLHSPIRIDDPLAARLEELGPVQHVVAPNAFHHLYVKGAQARYPKAELWGAPGVQRKQPALTFHHSLEDSKVPGAGELTSLFLAGAPMANEVIFLHRPSQTLIVSDLLFNVLEPEGAMTKLVLTLFGTRGRLGHSRFWRLLTKDRSAFRASVERLLGWDFSRLVVGHGEILEREAKPAVEQALAPLLSR